jgi:hypothetical protein
MGTPSVGTASATPADAAAVLAKATLAAARRLGLSNRDLARPPDANEELSSQPSARRGGRAGRAEGAPALVYIRVFASL